MTKFCGRRILNMTQIGDNKRKDEFLTLDTLTLNMTQIGDYKRKDEFLTLDTLTLSGLLQRMALDR